MLLETHDEKDKIIHIDYEMYITNLADIGLNPIDFVTSSVILSEIASRISASFKALRKPNPIHKKNLEEFIKSGREQGASKLEIDMDKSTIVGINLKGFEQLPGVNGVVGVETKNRVTLKVEYK